MMFIFGYVGMIFFDRLKDKSELVGIYAACGMMLLAGYFVFGMTQAVFSHNTTSILFILLLYLFLGQVNRAKHDEVICKGEVSVDANARTV